jgi:DNA-directed RNA polymerase specialized sigma24 family protein
VGAGCGWISLNSLDQAEGSKMEGNGKESVDRALTDEVSALFDVGFRENREKGLKIAAAIGADPDEAVQAAITMMVDLVTRPKNPYPCPRDKVQFGIAFRGLVRRIARSQVRKTKVRKRRLKSFERTLVRPLSAEEILNGDWAEASGWEGEKNRDMLESIDGDLVDGDPRDEPQPPPKYRLPQWPIDREAREVELMMIFRETRQGLPRMQNLAVMFHLQGLTREEAAEKMGISPKTYDEHLKRAKEALPWLMPKRWWMTYDARGRCDAVYRSDWNDIIFDMFRRFIGGKWQEAIDRRERLQADDEIEGAGDDDGESEE